ADLQSAALPLGHGAERKCLCADTHGHSIIIAGQCAARYLRYSSTGILVGPGHGRASPLIARHNIRLKRSSSAWSSLSSASFIDSRAPIPVRGFLSSSETAGFSATYGL